MPDLSIVVPTYKEAENLPHLLERIGKLRAASGLDVEVLVMDDDSRDGSAELVRGYGQPWVTIHVREDDHGLSQAVLDGLRRARAEVLLCMDADLSHPVEAIPSMLAALEAGADFVLGSRYVEGGSTSDDWGFLRWLNSRIATLLARPLTSAQDPMAGFFVLRRETFDRGEDLNPVGYKIGLELIVKCRCQRVVEVPIQFEDRRFGESKLTLRQQLLYLKHLRRLYIFKYGLWSELSQFFVVGAIGTGVNLAVLTALIAAGVGTEVAVGLAIFVSVCTNFVLNRRFSFSYARQSSWGRQFVRFLAASAAGAVVNYTVALWVLARAPSVSPQMASLAGIAAGFTFNFFASRYMVFRMRHVRPSRGAR